VQHLLGDLAARRLRRTPNMPEAQNTQPTGQPTWVEMHSVSALAVGDDHALDGLAVREAQQQLLGAVGGGVDCATVLRAAARGSRGPARSARARCGIAQYRSTPWRKSQCSSWRAWNGLATRVSDDRWIAAVRSVSVGGHRRSAGGGGRRPAQAVSRLRRWLLVRGSRRARRSRTNSAR
jgi:hypothetical protein